MDPLTHIVIGRAVVAAADDSPRAARGVAAAAILGALSPDVDAAIAFSGWDRYVRIHEFGTHSLAGAFAMACLTAVVVGGVGRFRDGRRDGDSTTVIAVHRAMPGFGVLFAAAAAGAMSHLILDIVCGGRIRLGWPLVQDRVTAPLVAMADPWFIAICVVGLLALWPGRRPLRLVSRAIIGASIVFLGVKGALLARALHSSRIDARLPALEAHWGSLTDWSAFERTDSSVRAWTISGAGAPAALTMSRVLAPDTPLVRASRSLEAVRNFLSVHDFAFPIERPVDDGRTAVLWSDLRYCWPSEPLDAPVVRADGSTSCGVWAGGEFGAGGHPLRQVVKIGSVVQARPAPP
jgi:membrane-bound metal-dependent hydrolase YbcI (DUF457 family)